MDSFLLSQEDEASTGPGQLHLQGSAERILVPEIVLSDIRAGDDLATARIERATELWLRPASSSLDSSSPQVGELAVIELALERLAERVVLDLDDEGSGERRSPASRTGALSEAVGDDAEASAAGDAVGLKVVVVDG
ncbi:MAG: hypothetical protein PVG07_16290, partial [Acidobacteriota bacterium]